MYVNDWKGKGIVVKRRIDFHRSKRNGTGREMLPDTIQPFDASSARPNSSERWANSYNNGNRSQHKSDSRHSSDR